MVYQHDTAKFKIWAFGNLWHSGAGAGAGDKLELSVTKGFEILSRTRNKVKDTSRSFYLWKSMLNSGMTEDLNTTLRPHEQNQILRVADALSQQAFNYKKRLNRTILKWKLLRMRLQ